MAGFATLRAVCGLAVPFFLASGIVTAKAQPAPSFKANCDTVKAELEKLNPPADTLVTIEVEDTLTLVEFDGAIAYMGMCGSPEPRVMCISYSIEGWKVGDAAILSGGYNPGAPDTIVLDPCLPYRAGGHG